VDHRNGVVAAEVQKKRHGNFRKHLPQLGVLTSLVFRYISIDLIFPIPLARIVMASVFGRAIR